MANIDESLKELFDRVLGSPRREYAGNGGWYEYDCPCCAEENCGKPDGKYNLAVNYEIGDENGMYMHCWRCGFAGSLSLLMKRYGNPDLYSKYKEIINDFKEAHLYEIQSGQIVISDDIVEKEELKLPNDCQSVFDGTEYGNRALEYLRKRGVDNFIIKKHRIKYVGNKYGNDYRNMIIIPSYDAFGNLNYYSGRDFTGKDKWNKKNPQISKTDIVFDEEYINWYEPVTLVEGPFDHIVTPNSIPLLGKSIDSTYAVYKALMQKSKHTVNIMLDNDALQTAQKNYNILNSGVLKDRIRIIYCPEGYDPSDIYRDYGKTGILRLLASASKIDDYTLSILNNQRINHSNRKWR